MTAHDHRQPDEPLPVAQWLHDHVVPSVVAVGLRIELALATCSPEARVHLDHAASILDDLAVRVRAEMVRHATAPPSGHSPSP